MKHDQLGTRLAFAVALLGTSAWAQTTTRVSLGSGGSQGNGNSFSPSVSADGRFVAFNSTASNLVPRDWNAATDVFVRDLRAAKTVRVSVDSHGLSANGDSYDAVMSPDGRYVAFSSDATNLVAGDTNGTTDIFVHDLKTGTTTRVSVDSTGVEGDGPSGYPTPSADGRFVAFGSDATNLVTGDTNGTTDIFVHDLLTGTTARVSVDSAGGQSHGYSNTPSISADGRFVAFVSDASDLVPGDTNGKHDVFVHDLVTATTVRVNVDSGGLEGDSNADGPSISGDGREVVFWSNATNLVPGDTNNLADVFMHDLQSGVTTRLSVGPGGVEGDNESLSPAISSDGRYVVFGSYATNLVVGDTNSMEDVFVYDLQNNTTVRVDLSSAGAQTNDDSAEYGLSISSNGRYVAFDSDASNLDPGDTNGFPDAFVFDRESAFTAFCFGDGTQTACPCGNSGLSGHGCENSAATGGALLTASGVASPSEDTLQFVAVGELPTSASIVLQGNSAITPARFGDGLRCTAGALKRLYAKNASGGVVTAPEPGDPSISARSAILGDPIPLGATRQYQVYYRDPSTSFCPSPLGDTFNVTNAIAVRWGY